MRPSSFSHLFSVVADPSQSQGKRSNSRNPRNPPQDHPPHSLLPPLPSALHCPRASPPFLTRRHLLFTIASISHAPPLRQALVRPLLTRLLRFAISHSLARVLAKVLDSCLVGYAHLYGSDARTYSCLAELGVGLTHDPGFHQVDMRGDLFGMLSAHPLSPLVSLHHLDAVDPIFPDMNKTDALQLFFKAANADPARIVQQTVCYHSSGSMTVSVAWGYAVQVFEGNVLLPDLLSLQRTFMPWKRGAKVEGHFMFNTREYPRDPCKRPAVFYLQSVVSDENGVWSEYARSAVRNCLKSYTLEKLKNIRVFSPKLELSTEQIPDESSTSSVL